MSAYRSLMRIFALFAICCVLGSDGNKTEKSSNNMRKKRLLFYDEDGNLVKTFTNPFLSKDFTQNPEALPFFGNFYKQLYGFLPPKPPSPLITYMIPVSDEVVQQINQDPVYQNKYFLPSSQGGMRPHPSCDGKRTQIPSQRSCSNFLNCWDGWAVEQECPEGLFFSSQGFCDYPLRVDCGNRLLRDESTTPQCHKDLETYRNEARCSEFFVCVNRSPVRFRCPADLYFNEALGICDYRYRVKCNVDTTEESSVVTPEKPEKDVETEPTEPMTLVKMLLSKSQGNTDLTTNIAISRKEAIDQLQLSRVTHFA